MALAIYAFLAPPAADSTGWGLSSAHAQLATPGSDPTAITTPTHSILLTPAQQTALQSWWTNPAAGYQATVQSSVNAAANQSLSLSAPSNLGDSQNQAAIAQAKAMRWMLTGNGDTTNADFVAVESVLQNYAKVTGGSSITSPLVATDYFTAFDFINSGLTTTQRNAVISQLNGNVLSSLGNPTAVNNQYFINYGSRGFYALLTGNQANLNSAMHNLQTAFNGVTTNDGFTTDGDRYLNYTMGSMPAFLNAYKNASGDAAGTAQYVNVANQEARYALGIRLPNGTSPSFHNSDNAPIAIQELSNLVSDPTLKAATVWYAQQLNGFQWESWTNALNNDGTYTDLLWSVDNSAGAAAPNWSPTYFSDGQARISVFKNDWGTTSNYLATTAGIDGNNSSFVQADTGAITLAANGTQILVEPGYARYNGVQFLGQTFGADSPMPNTPAHTTPGPNLDTSLATEHNVLLARNTGTSTWGIGASGKAETLTASDLSITNRLDSGERGNFKGVADFSTLNSTYSGGGAGSGVEERRSTGMINESATDHGYFVMADSFRRTDATNKDFAVNLIGKSTADNTQIMVDTANYKEIRWSVNSYPGTTNNGATESGPPYNAPVSGQVIAHIVSSNAMNSVAQDQTWMVDNWGVFIQTQRMNVSISNAQDGAFLTFFETGAAGFASHWTVTPFSGAQYAAARIDSTDGWTDWHVSQTSTSSVHPAGAGSTVSIDAGALQSNAQYAYLRDVGSKLDSAMIAQGTFLTSHGSQIVSADHAITASFLFSDLEHGHLSGTLSMDGYVNNTVLTFYHLPRAIQSITYNGTLLAPLSDDSVQLPWLTGYDSVAFSLTLAPVPEPGTCVLMSLSLLGLLGYGYRQRSRAARARS